MSEDKKYYTPTIEEFHVGFECELRNSSDEPYEWEHFKIIGVDDAKISGRLMDWSFYDSANAIKENQIRVKYLDREDIESLGFDNYISPHEYNHSWNYKGGKEPKIYVWFNNPIPVVRIYHRFPATIFQGSIKNKYELKKLMQQLGITQ